MEKCKGISRISMTLLTGFCAVVTSLPYQTVYLILAIGFFSATQDICADALRIELVEKRELGEASAVFVIGWRIGAILLSGVATFYLAEFFRFKQQSVKREAN